MLKAHTTLAGKDQVLSDLLTFFSFYDCLLASCLKGFLRLQLLVLLRILRRLHKLINIMPKMMIVLSMHIFLILGESLNI